MNVWTKLHGNPSCSWMDLTKNKNVNLIVVLEEKSGDHQSNYNSLPGDHEYMYKIS